MEILGSRFDPIPAVSVRRLPQRSRRYSWRVSCGKGRWLVGTGMRTVRRFPFPALFLESLLR
jgi:hypothetical protein